MTLGGVAPSVDAIAQIGMKRHPTLSDGVIVGSGAQILGPIVVGENSPLELMRLSRLVYQQE